MPINLPLLRSGRLPGIRVLYAVLAAECYAYSKEADSQGCGEVSARYTRLGLYCLSRLSRTRTN